MRPSRCTGHASAAGATSAPCASSARPADRRAAPRPQAAPASTGNARSFRRVRRRHARLAPAGAPGVRRRAPRGDAPPRRAARSAGCPPRAGRGAGLAATSTPQHRLAHKIDMPYLAAARAHLLTLTATQARASARADFDLAAQFAALFAAALAPGESDESDESDELDALEEPEYLLFGRLGAMIAQAAPEEARTIWEPLLALGTPAESRIAPFLTEQWRTALELDPVPATFALVIKEQLAFAAACTTWRGWKTDDLLLELVCLNRSGPPAYGRSPPRAPDGAAARVVRGRRRPGSRTRTRHARSSRSSASRSPPTSSRPPCAGWPNANAPPRPPTRTSTRPSPTSSPHCSAATAGSFATTRTQALCWQRW